MAAQVHERQMYIAPSCLYKKKLKWRADVENNFTRILSKIKSFPEPLGKMETV